MHKVRTWAVGALGLPQEGLPFAAGDVVADAVRRAEPDTGGRGGGGSLTDGGSGAGVAPARVQGQRPRSSLCRGRFALAGRLGGPGRERPLCHAGMSW